LKKALIAGLVFVVAWGGYGMYRFLTREAEIQVLETAEVREGNVRSVLVATGLIAPQDGAEVKIGTRATGVIEDMYTRIGDRVKQGQLIAQIDDREVVKTVGQNRAALRSARDSVERIRRTYPDRIREAQAEYDYAQATHIREKELIKREFTTQDAVDRAASALKVMEARLRRLESEFETELRVAEANLQEAEFRLEREEIRLSYYQVRAPIDGIVSDLTAQKGETIVTGLQVANLVTIIDPERLELRIYVDETDIGRVSVGRQVEYHVDTYPERIFTGVIDKIRHQPVVKDNIVYYLAVVTMPGEDSRHLRPEMTSYVRIILEDKRQVLILPNAAVKFDHGEHVGYRLMDSGVVEKVKLEIGLRGEDHTEILSGMNKGDLAATKLILPVGTERAPRSK